MGFSERAKLFTQIYATQVAPKGNAFGDKEPSNIALVKPGSLSELNNEDPEKGAEPKPKDGLGLSGFGQNIKENINEGAMVLEKKLSSKSGSGANVLGNVSSNQIREKGVPNGPVRK